MNLLAQVPPDPWADLLQQGPLVAALIGVLFLFITRRIVTTKEKDEAVAREKERAEEWKQIAQGGAAVAETAAASLEQLTAIVDQKINAALKGGSS